MSEPTPAIVMNAFYTGLGIARSLGEHRIPVISLTAQHGIYGNFSRYSRTVFCPDSRTEPDALRAFLIAFGNRIGKRAVIFPTRDDDLLFLDRFRSELDRYFSLVMPESSVLNACLNKWDTYLWAQRAGVPTPNSWLFEDTRDLARLIGEITYPCVLKPVAAYKWRQGGNWRLVGARKAIGIASRTELIAEYESVVRADSPVLVQEMVPGGDDSLVIAACYMDFNNRWVAGFNTRKLLQAPELFGTGCIVQAADYPELTAPTARLLETMRFSGIAEVEYKWDAAVGEYKLIEINPRPWDQHRLGGTCGADLAYLAYCEHAGLPTPAVAKRASDCKWIAEDTFIRTALTLLRRRDPKLRSLFRLARGRRLYAIWYARDPLPFIAYFATRFISEMFGLSVRVLWRALTSNTASKRKKSIYAGHLESGKHEG